MDAPYTASRQSEVAEPRRWYERSLAAGVLLSVVAVVELAAILISTAIIR